MSTPVRASDRDLRALAAIISRDRPDVPADGLPTSLLADLMGQIRCDALSLDGWDSGGQTVWFSQEIPSGDAAIGYSDLDPVYWEHYWESQPDSYPARTGAARRPLARQAAARGHAGNQDAPPFPSPVGPIRPGRRRRG